MIQGNILPPIEAVLNGISSCLLLVGLWAVKTRRYPLHRNVMWMAMITSASFLTCYLIYHFGFHLHQKYYGEYPGIYFPILFTHTILAVFVLPLVLVTVGRALKAQKEDPEFRSPQVTARFARHRKIARWTFPIWLYVSVTGVMIYWMLYQMPQAPLP